MLIENLKSTFGIGLGAGMLLVLLPSAALFLGIGHLSEHPMVGLPVLAVFGIVLLIGTLALASYLFQRLGLANPAEALGLPTGSIRAAIALSLVVLFAIISIMLYQSMSQPYRITGLTDDQMQALVKQPGNRVLAIKPSTCATIPGAPSAAAAPGTSGAPATCFEVHLVQPAGQDAIDLGKQLLVLIGTLMTSVTSFYFAARTAAPAKEPPPRSETGKDNNLATPPVAAASPGPAPIPGGAGAQAAAASHDGCGVEVSSPTKDEDLPAARGGVA